MNKHICDTGVMLQSESQEYDNWYKKCLPFKMSDLFNQGPSYKDDVLFEIKRLCDSKERNNSFMPRKFVENLFKMFNDAVLQVMYFDAIKLAKVIAPV